MSFFSRRSRRAGTTGGIVRSLIHWLTGSVLAGSSLSAALPVRSSQPYLATISPLPLRFSPPPPDLSTEPVPAAPPNPDGVVGEVAQSNQEAVAPLPKPQVSTAPVETPKVEPDTRITSDTPNPQPSEPPTPVRPSVEIIPDDLAAPVMPEDLLPFFLPPQLPTPPPSRATYRLQ